MYISPDLGLENSMIMQIPAGIEWVIIIVVIVLLFFGVKKIPELARNIGKASAEFKKAQIGARREIDKMKAMGTDPDREELEEIAGTLDIDCQNKTDSELRAAIETEINRQKKD